MSQAGSVTPLLSLADAAEARPASSHLQIAWRRLRRNGQGMAALALLGAICAIALAAPWITGTLLEQDPNRGRLTQRFLPPSSTHFLGTDDFGRDTLARLIHAGRVSLQFACVVALVSLTVGVSLGLFAGFFGRWIDDMINALIQLFVNIPVFFLLIMLSVTFRPSPTGLALVVGLFGWTNIARLVRGRVLSERERDYVSAATLIGAGPLRLMYRHILPNVTSVVLVVVGFDIGQAILTEAALSALGLGVQIPTASWGNMLSKSLDNLNRGWWLIAAPGVAIIITVFSIYTFFDALRDAFDPRLRG